ncbi:MAG: cytidylate kinase-like family protein [Planctomycetes bacterium]|nr:cytidylate kinase-like family protein [Planctomycetota bacterium]
MAAKTISRESNLSRFVEKQMRNWEIARGQHPECDGRQEVADFITLANIVGAGGNDVAAALGRELGWPVFDRELLTTMAHDDQTRAALYRTMDERDLGWLEVTVRCLAESSFRKNDYFHRLVETVLCLARQGPAVFVGRSADLILPRTKGLRVKLIASMDYCARNFAQRGAISLEKARAEVARIEAERHGFIRHHFHVDATDPMRFDLLVNIERFSTRQIVELVLAAHADRLAASIAR